MNTAGRVTRSRARCTGEELAQGIQSERKGPRPPSSALKGSSSVVPRPALADLSNDSNKDKHAADVAPFTKEVPASTLTDKDDGKVPSTDKLDEDKADADDFLMPATPTQEGLTPEHPVQGAVKGGAASSEAAAIQQQLLQQAQRLSLDDESGITPVRLNQPTPANTPVGNAADAMGKAVSGPDHGSRLSAMRLEEEMMLTPLDDQERRGLAEKSFMVAAAEAIAQAAAYPTQVSELASVIVSGDQAAANRAPAPEEDKAEAPVDEVTVKETKSVQTATCEKEPLKNAAGAHTDNRSIGEIQHDLKYAIKIKRAAKKAPLGTSSESTTYPGISSANAANIQDDASSALCNAMSDLGIDPEVRKPLRGQPLPQGRHMRFADSGAVTESPMAERLLLRGVPAPSGGHLRFRATPEK